MLTDSVLAAIDAAVGPTTTCRCGRALVPSDRDGAIWLACAAAPSTGPRRGRLATLLGSLLHDSWFITTSTGGAHAEPRTARQSARSRRAVAAA